MTVKLNEHYEKTSVHEGFRSLEIIEWGLRLLTEGGMKTKTIAKTISFPNTQNPPSDILDVARKSIVELQGWDAHLYIVSRDVIDVIEEWSI